MPEAASGRLRCWRPFEKNLELPSSRRFPPTCALPDLAGVKDLVHVLWSLLEKPR